MAKIATDLEQSKLLAKILPIESADMYYWYSGKRYYIESMDDGDYVEGNDIPAWSLSALIEIIPIEIFNDKYIINITESITNKLIITYDDCINRSCYPNLSACCDTFIDSCVEMIVKLKERNLL